MLRTLSNPASETNWDLFPTSRKGTNPGYTRFSFPDSQVDNLLDECKLREGDFVINCAGWIPQRASGNSSKELLDAVLVNAALPLSLGVSSKNRGLRLISIGTDCVFSGKHNQDYVEDSPLSPIDFYGTTKALAEMSYENQMVLRTSIIGQSPRTGKGLFEWFKAQPPHAEIDGYSNHIWNGTSTSFFARVVRGIISNDEFEAGVQHLVPSDTCSKADLLEMFKKKLGRADVSVNHSTGQGAVRRVLGTSNPDRNKFLWELAGFKAPPTIREAVASI